MPTLLIQLNGPMQSWRLGPRLERRPTQPLPTKSGVVGLLAGALGRPRESSIADLAALRMGVRVDRPGVLETDYQIVRNVIQAKGSGLKNAQTWRGYLADAAFLVGLEGERGILEELARALKSPRFVPYLGQKGFYPAAPLYRGIRLGKGLHEALESEPLTIRAREPVEVDVYVEDPEGELLLPDAPEEVLAGIGTPRSFSIRAVRHYRVTVQPDEEGSQ